MLTSLSIENVRCIESANLELDPRGTGIVGPNGAGKTSLLESIFFLAHGRSFRTSQRAKLIGPKTSSARVVGSISLPDQRWITAGVEHGSGRTRARLGGRDVAGISEIAELLPVQVIEPGVHRLIEEGSVRRRRMLDWGVFHVKHEFLVPWRRYQRALAQRNAALRANTDPRIWDSELEVCAGEVDSLRRAYFEILSAQFAELASSLLGQRCEIEYHRGWPDEKTITEALRDARSRDLRLKTTTVGPHRADVIFRVDGAVARDRVSRGQQKVIASAFVLAQLLVSTPHTDRRPCLLLDDPAAELDVDSLGKILRAIEQTPAQLIVTSLNPAGLRGIEIGKTFHVEQGRFTAML